MERYAVDFGTSNTVVARWNFAKEEPQTISFPAITAPAVGAMPPVTPSVLYYLGLQAGTSAPHLAVRGTGTGIFRRPHRAALPHQAAFGLGAERRNGRDLYGAGQRL